MTFTEFNIKTVVLIVFLSIVLPAIALGFAILTTDYVVPYMTKGSL